MTILNHRLITVDPLSEKYLNNSVYAFSENKIISHRELEGLEAVFIHGTWAKKDTWGTNFVSKMMSSVGRGTEKPFFGNWSGANKARDRRDAAEKMVDWLTSSSNPQVDQKHVTLISHSHGGNVAKEINNELAEQGWTVDMINIETPQRSDFQVETVTDGTYLNFYSNQDLVQTLGTSDMATPDGSRLDSKADKNINLNEGFGILKWIKNTLGHSLHNDKNAQNQIVEETKKAFNENE